MPFKAGLLAVNSQTQVVFISRCNLARPEPPFRSLRKSEHHLDVIVETSATHKGSYLGRHFLARQSCYEACEVEGVRRNVAEASARPAARRVSAPLSLLLSSFLHRGRQPILRVFDLNNANDT